MTAWTQWEIVRRQVTICGRVVDAQRSPMASVPVTVCSGPEEFEARVASAALRAGSQRDDLHERGDRTETRSDGIYFFLDRPSGRYKVRCVDVRSGAQGEKTISVPAKHGGRAKATVADFALGVV